MPSLHLSRSSWPSSEPKCHGPTSLLSTSGHDMKLSSSIEDFHLEKAKRMALFGLVWLLRVRQADCACVTCKKDQIQHQENPDPSQEHQENYPTCSNTTFISQASHSAQTDDDCEAFHDDGVERTTAVLAQVCVSSAECETGNVGSDPAGDAEVRYEAVVTQDATVQTDFEDDECFSYEACGMQTPGLYESPNGQEEITLDKIPENSENAEYYERPSSPPWQYLEVCLERGPAGLGFSIAGGCESISNPGSGHVVITRLTDDGAATMDGRLRLNDTILQVNGVSVVGVPHSAAVEALKRAGNHVTLYVRRPTSTRRPSRVRLEKGSRGLGFSIAGGRGGARSAADEGIFVTQVGRGGAADLGGLQVGDRLMAVLDPEIGERTLAGVTHAEAVSTLKSAGDVVELLVIPAARASMQDESLCERQRSQATSCSALHELAPNDQDIPRIIRTVTLQRTGSRLGMDIVGGEGGGWGVFVSGVASNGAARGRLHRGDQILAVDGADLTSASHEQAARALKGTGSVVTIMAQYKPEEYRCLETKIRELNRQILRDRLAAGGELTKSEEDIYYRR